MLSVQIPICYHLSKYKAAECYANLKAITARKYRMIGVISDYKRPISCLNWIRSHSVAKVSMESPYHMNGSERCI